MKRSKWLGSRAATALRIRTIAGRNLCAGIAFASSGLAGCGPSNGATPATDELASQGAGRPGADDSTKNPTRNGPDGCPVDSGFDGDDSCLVAPASADGVQLHFGPKDYDDPDDVSRFTVAPGRETNTCYFTKLPNATDLTYGQRHGSMRPGSHHFIARAIAEMDEPEGIGTCDNADATGKADDIGSFQQRAYTYPPSGADYEGLANTLPAGRQGMLNAHFINETEKPLLAEAWLNYDRVEPAPWMRAIMPIGLTGGLGMRIAPHTERTLHFSCSPDQTVRVLELESHFHAHARRLSAWKVDALGTKTLVYEGFDWQEPAHFDFDSSTTNPTSDRLARRAGAASGLLTVGPEEALEWECEINNDSNGVLTFRNEVRTGEMCILGGAAVAVSGETQPFACTLN